MTNNSYANYLQLVAKALEAAKSYYDTSVEIMTDAEYDALIEEIEILSEENGWSDATELLSAVAAGASAGGDVNHAVPMLSLGKANSTEALKSFISSVNGDIKLEPKLDGLAISAIYKNGKLVRIATRGDGLTGEDITNRVSNVKGLPEKIAFTGDLEVRGEVFITSDDFIIASKNRLAFNYAEWKKRNAETKTVKLDSLYAVALENRASASGKGKSLKGAKTDFAPEKFLFANSRNAVAGSLRNEKNDYVVPMTFACYDILSPTLGVEDNYSKRIFFASTLGIQTANELMPPELRSITGNDLTPLERFGEVRKTVNYPTDGIVLKADLFSERERLGSGSKSPKWAVAYKYPSVASQTQVLDIEEMIGRTGRLSLRARLAPVLVDGTRIEYVSLHNVNWMSEKDIRIGDTVNVRRANDVIPYIDSYVASLRPITAKPWTPPAVCPQCGEAWDKSTLLWRCTSPSCGELNGLIFAAGRDYFDWEGLSEKILTRLNDAGKVTDIADVFALTREDLSSLYMGDNKNGDKLLGRTVGDKIYDEIQRSKSRPLSAVLAALGIRTLGRTFGRRLASHFGSMSAILKASVDELIEVEGIAIKKAEIIHAGLREKRAIIVRLKDAGVTMTAEKKTIPQGSPFAGKKIVVTGSIPGYTRSSAQELMATIGATPSSSVSPTTDLLVADAESENSSKYKKAVALGVEIISPEDFLQKIKG